MCWCGFCWPRRSSRYRFSGRSSIVIISSCTTASPERGLSTLDPPHHEHGGGEKGAARQRRGGEWRPILQQADVREEAIQQVKEDAEHDAEEHLDAHHAGARVHVG